MEKFYGKVDAGPGGGCHIWLGARTSHGYGTLRVHGKTTTAHRLAYRMSKGDVPSGLYVCHSCDRKHCVNPEHLWLGTAQDNMDDKVAKGRHVTLAGEDVPNAKLTDALVREIRSSSEPGTVIAKRLGVSDSNISRIRRRLAWRHVP